MPRLIALAGPLQGRSIPLEEPSMSLGRHPSNDVVVPQISVSRHHARLERFEAGYLLRDCDSWHGTFVNERAVQKHALEDGDRITVGKSLFLYQSDHPKSSCSLTRIVEEPRPFEEASTAHSVVLKPGPDSTSTLRADVDTSEQIDSVAYAKDSTQRLIGESESIDRLRSLIVRLARVDSTVLIDGESGCGKELVAQLIHEIGPRSSQPFVAINCATLSETLLESELFGHEKGAFTGAVRQRIGQFERAHQGTIFLDEVGEIPISLQAKLLRVLQERQFERLGGGKKIEVNVRVLAATHRDLTEEVAAGRFRSDLFYRLNVIRLHLPPLRTRSNDILLLARHFLYHHGKQMQRPPLALSRPARAALLSYPWPGNVRELSNAIERAVVLAQNDVLEVEDLPEAVVECSPSTVPTGDYHTALNKMKRQLIEQALDHTQGNVTSAAKQLGLSPNYLHRLIGNLGLREHLGLSRKT